MYLSYTLGPQKLFILERKVSWMDIRGMISSVVPWVKGEERHQHWELWPNHLTSWEFCFKHAMLSSHQWLSLPSFTAIEADQEDGGETQSQPGLEQMYGWEGFPPLTQWPLLGSLFPKPTSTSMNQTPLDPLPIIRGSTEKRQIYPVHLHPMVHFSLLLGIQLKGVLQSKVPLQASEKLQPRRGPHLSPSCTSSCHTWTSVAFAYVNSPHFITLLIRSWHFIT